MHLYSHISHLVDKDSFWSSKPAKVLNNVLYNQTSTRSKVLESEIERHPAAPGRYLLERSTSALWAAWCKMDLSFGSLGEVTSLPVVQSDVVVNRSGTPCLEKNHREYWLDLSLFRRSYDDSYTTCDHDCSYSGNFCPHCKSTNYFQLANYFSFRTIVLAVHPF